MSLALSHAFRTQTTAPNGRVAVEPVAKRIRVRFGGEVIADTTNALLLLERDHLPVYYLPLADINADFLEAVETTSFCPWKGTARYWDVVVGDRRAADAMWSYPDAHENALDLSDYAAFYWDRVDEWLEEDEPVSCTPRPVRAGRRAALVAPRHRDRRRHGAGRLGRHADRVRDGQAASVLLPARRRRVRRAGRVGDRHRLALPRHRAAPCAPHRRWGGGGRRLVLPGDDARGRRIAG